MGEQAVLPARQGTRDGKDKDREFAFTYEEFDRIRKIVKEHAGIALSDVKQDMVYSRLARRIRQLRLNSFKEYCHFLEQDSGDEMVNLINAITTNLTSFFREPHHFQYLANDVLPELMRRRAAQRRLRIWSAGCSTGEEPYTIAMVVKENVPSSWDVKILATDLDSNVLEKAQTGLYTEERVTGIDAARRKRWFLRGKGANAGLVKVSPELQEIIQFKQLNLMGGWPMKGPLDIIFCRNVVIYFDKPTQAVLFDRYANILANDGYLFVGHSESLYKVTQRFELIGGTMYRKRN